MNHVTFFVPNEFFAFSDSMKTIKIVFEDVENKGITRRVSLPIVKSNLRCFRISKGIFMVDIPYWFIRDKGLDAITKGGQMKWNIPRRTCHLKR